MATFTRSPDRRYVYLTHGNFGIEWDTWFGGAPLGWRWGALPLMANHPGEGFQNVIEEGQDLTQATSNGETTFHIARVGDTPAELAYRNYYAREVVQQDFPVGATYYQVQGFYPDFWLSSEAPDDAMPPKANGQQQDGWIVRWRYPNHQLPAPYNTLPFPDRGGAPVFFQATPNQTAGILMEGNELITPAVDNSNWNSRLREIPNGRVAFRCRISFSQASPDAVAGVMFCRAVPAGAGKNMDDAFNSPGYFLNINRSGLIELRRHDNVVVWSQVNAAVQYAANVVQGCKIEIRTTNNDENQLEVWIQEALVTTVNLQAGTRLKGPNFGLYAYTAYDPLKLNYVKFSDRDVFNVGTEIHSTYTPMADGSIETDLVVKGAGNVPEPRKVYRVNVAAFLARFVSLDTVWMERPHGTAVFGPTKTQDAVRPIVNAQPTPVINVYAGRGDTSGGLYCTPTLVTLTSSNVAAPGEHALVSPEQVSSLGCSLLHLNALPAYQTGNPPWTAEIIQMKAKWWPFAQ